MSHQATHRLRGPAIAAGLLVFAATVGASAVGPKAANDSSSAGPPAVHARAEVAQYVDNTDVLVVSPNAAVEAEQALQDWGVDAGYLVDVVSAASVDVVSTASPRWTEVRHQGSLGGHYHFASVSGAVSVEPDYLAWSVGGALSFELADKMVTPRLGYAFGHDIAGRKGTPLSVYALELDRHRFTPSVALVLNRSTELDLLGDVVLESGRQENPYRYVPLFAPTVAPAVPLGAAGKLVDALRLPGRLDERLPDARQRFAISVRLANRGPGRTLIVRQRLYADSWLQLASSSDVRYVMQLGAGVSVWPHLRLHLQNGASFWERAYVATAQPGLLSVPEYRTGDRELGPLVVTTFGGGLRYNIGGRPQRQAWSLLARVDGAHTSYLDALFIRRRLGLLGALDLEKTFE